MAVPQAAQGRGRSPAQSREGISNAGSRAESKTRSPSSGERAEAPELEPGVAGCTAAGDIVTVSGRKFEILSELGRGGWGVVWEAVEIGGPNSAQRRPVAVKRCEATDVKVFRASVLEADVLRMLTESLDETSEAVHHVPLYVAHAAGDGCALGATDLVMTKAEGQQLDHWLYGASDERLLTVSVQRLLEGPPLANSRLSTQTLAQAAAAATALVAQASSVFSTLQGIAYHRDISARNVLVRDGGQDHLDFTIVDFGLAALSESWRRGEWRTLDLVGDLRYWSPASWMVFAHGSSHLEQLRYNGFRRMYEERLDHFALGILALEIFFALWGGPGAGTVGAGGGAKRPQQGEPLAVAHATWSVYWSTTYGLFQKFHADGGRSRSALRRRVQNSLPLLVADHKALVAALRTTAREARSAVQDDGGLNAVAPLFLTCAELLDPRGEMSWERVPEALLPRSPGEHGAAEPQPADATACSAVAANPQRRKNSKTARSPGPGRGLRSSKSPGATGSVAGGSSRPAVRRTPSLPPRQHSSLGLPGPTTTRP